MASIFNFWTLYFYGCVAHSPPFETRRNCGSESYYGFRNERITWRDVFRESGSTGGARTFLAAMHRFVLVVDRLRNDGDQFLEFVVSCIFVLKNQQQVSNVVHLHAVCRLAGDFYPSISTACSNLVLQIHHNLGVMIRVPRFSSWSARSSRSEDKRRQCHRRRS